eukprot:scaffold6357_cov248-Pinguiococcus_pyrenoidosus.AAC.2
MCHMLPDAFVEGSRTPNRSSCCSVALQFCGREGARDDTVGTSKPDVRLACVKRPLVHHLTTRSFLLPRPLAWSLTGESQLNALRFKKKCHLR